MICQRTLTLITVHMVNVVNMVGARFGPWTTKKIQGLYIHLPLYMWHRAIVCKLYHVPMFECIKNKSLKKSTFEYLLKWKYEYDFET